MARDASQDPTMYSDSRDKMDIFGCFLEHQETAESRNLK